MYSKKSNLRVIGAFAALATLAFAASCRGFFVKPTLSSITVSPSTSTINAGTGSNSTVQMHATANFNDGSTGSASVSWTIAPASGGDTAATISNGGLVTASTTLIGSMTVTATALQNGTLTATATVNVQPPALNSITMTCLLSTLQQGETTTCTAEGISGGTSYNITSIATWTSSQTSFATIDATGTVTANSNALGGTTAITASLEGITSAPFNITVAQ